MSAAGEKRLDIVADRRRLVFIGMLAVFVACVIFAAARFAVTVTTGKATPWWANAAGAIAIPALYLWYRRSPETRSGAAAHGTGMIATVALVVPVAYGMSSSIWWLSLVGFAMVLLGRPREAWAWATGIVALVVLVALLEPVIQIQGAAGEPPLERALARTVFVVLLLGIAAGFRKVANERAVALADAAEALERANAARNRFLAHMSHEIRTPLHGVISMSELALARSLPDRARREVQTALDSARLLLGLLNNVLDVTRAQSAGLVLDVRPFPLHATLGAVLRSLAARARSKGLEFSATADDGLAENRLGDPYRFSQIALNLVGNALKFTERGSVTVRLRSVPLEPDRVLLEVSDTGPGIPTGRLSAVFEPFTQARPEDTRFGGGVGLGLTIVRQLALLMNGSVTVESVIGEGCVFTASLGIPVDAGAAATPGPVSLLVEGERAEAPVSAANLAGSLHVLVCEDDGGNQIVVKAMLEHLGHEFTVVESAEAAWQKVERSTFDALLTDVELPGMDGLELARRIRARERRLGLPRLPIVAGTAHVSEGERARLYEAGIDVHLPKPFDLRALSDALVRALETRSPESAGVEEKG
ncbi:MAG TPA: ATP-binding protein [Thermoanaerobaculia bacterium]|nr:ATP-binding protein [Thermoanaerobaculia bacterium]